MIQFLGNIEAKADAKGRVFIPATFRKQLQAASEERLVFQSLETKSFERMKLWFQVIETKVSSLWN